MIKYILLWFPMVVIAILNGALRQGTFGKHMPELKAHQVSTLIGSILLGLYIWLLSRVWPFESGGQAITTGLIWLGMTVCFEFLFGRFARKLAWSQMLHDYNLAAGRVWALLLIWITIAPYVFYWVH